MAWKKSASPDAQGEFAVRTDRPPSPANPHYVRITSRAGSYGITNDGFRAVSVEAGKRYVVTMLARRVAGTTGLTVGIENARLEEAGTATIASLPADWGIVTATITPPVTNTRAASASGSTARAPSTSTWCRCSRTTPGRTAPNGLRADLVQLLADLKPGFLRFPGGCIVEGRYLETRYRVEEDDRRAGRSHVDHQPLERRIRPSRRARLLPVVRPRLLRVLPAGRRHRRRAAADPQLRHGLPVQHQRAGAARQLDPYVQDALDLIEFANGPVTSAWGKRRADMGHPAPFNLKFIGVGNEQWGPQYIERYELFAQGAQGRSIPRSS